MRKRIFTTVLLAIFAFTLSIGQSNHHQNWKYRQHDGYQKHHNQNLEQVLDRHYNRGYLERREYRTFKRELRYLRLAKRVAKADGRVSRKEKRLIRDAEAEFLRDLEQHSRDYRGRHQKPHRRN